MRVELILTGAELLDGRIINSNEAYLSGLFYENGYEVQQSTTLGDDLSELASQFKTAASRSDILIISGGLGPTHDDNTRDALAQAAGVPLIQSETALQHIQGYYQKTNREMPAANAKQALFPKGAEIIPNPNGTAPGIWTQIEKCLVCALPGVPKELKPMMSEYVMPKIHTEKPIGGTIQTHQLKTYGWGESKIMDAITELLPFPDGIELSFQVKDPEVHLVIRSKHENKNSASKVLETTIAQLKQILAPIIFSESKSETLIQTIVKTLMEKNLTLSLAESCTGGLIAKELTDIPGISKIFCGSAVTYANSAKQRLLGVSGKTLATYGAVSKEVAKEMVTGALNKFDTDLAIAVTGIAGPGGGTPEKPVGQVYIACATQSTTIVKAYQFGTNRDRIRRLAVHAALHQCTQLIPKKS